jgi:DNA-binding NarL/FixJ family response regulator
MCEAPGVIRILLADDHTLVRQALARMLESAGHAIVGEVSDGLAVVDAVEHAAPDILLLDLAMPGLHGLDVIPQVVRRSPGARIIVLTGDGREDFVLGALRHGASGYVLKGADSVELLSAIAHVAAGGRYVTPTLSDHLVRAFLAVDASAPADPYESLSTREREVFHLMAEGVSNADLAARLCISARTLESHRASIMRKLSLQNHTEIVRFAIRKGLLSAD